MCRWLSIIPREQVRKVDCEAGSYSLVVQKLPGKQEVLSLNPGTRKKERQADLREAVDGPFK